MSALAALRALVARWDDQTWAALANKGLLRRARKDLESTTPVLVAEGDDGVEVRVGEHTVSFGPEGPATATCSCPAATVCQHLVAAGLWLSADEEPAGVDLHAELMSLDSAALQQYGGRAAYRWAVQLVADLDPADLRVTGQQVVIGLSSPRVTFRYAGGGPTALVSDVRLGQLEKHQVAAVLAYQAAHGQTPEPPPPTRRIAPRTQHDTTTDSRRRLRAAVAGLLTDTARLGAAHLSPGLHQRFETVAVWAQGAEYHRLALLLRRLADQVELLLERNARADEHALVDGCAVAFALVSALDEAAARGPEPIRLVGRARTSYDAVPTLDLLGLGGAPWRAGSGYHGLACLFWWPAEQRFVSWTDARPEDMFGFDPRARWQQDGPWTGLVAPAAAAGRAVRLLDARLSPNGRLSGVERTHAVVTVPTAPTLLDIPAVADWSGLERRMRTGRSLLAEPDPLGDWVVLAPTDLGPPMWDSARQTVVRIVRDATGAGLPLELRWTPLAAHAVQRLESLTAAELPAGTRIVARLGARSGQLVAEPLSLLRGATEIDTLHFDRGQHAVPMRNLEVGDGEDGDELPARSFPGPLLELRTWTLRQLERGTGAAAAHLLVEALDRRHRDLRDVGLTVFPSVHSAIDPAGALLRSHYLAQQVAALIT